MKMVVVENESYTSVIKPAHITMREFDHCECT